MTPPVRSTRREFLKRSAALGAAVPMFLPRAVLGGEGEPGANERIAVGFIGAGGRAGQLMDQLPAPGQIVAVADCFLPRAEAAAAAHGGTWAVYQDYRKILDRKDIDAVVVPTTDHARALICVHACQAGKDIYAEKPLTLTIGEGRALVREARKYNRVFQVGSQQRSMEVNRFACELVRSGGIGKIKVVQAVNYTGPGRYVGLPEEPVPDGLDWDAWCNQTDLRPYNKSLHLGWMGYRDYSGGEMTNWGAHGVDQVQWALGKSLTGPTEIWPVTEGPNGKVSMRYADGTLVRFELDGGPVGGAIFVGEKCKIEINRNKFTTNPPDFVANPPKPAVAEVWEGPGWQAKLHLADWLDCIKTRQTPRADVEIGHRSISACHLANLARELGRKLRWDPDREQFPDDPEANARLTRPRRKGYELPEMG
ncbi:MAG: Gfo/Idh/MocA family oxidoreductase [Pirellulales bacterium]|nr:Gfo/Idh/MocA family oxidoreductase [Pirellulales bacterium]